MPLPPLPNWETTRDNLQRAAQLLNAVRVQSVEKMPNHLHHSLHITPRGLSTGILSNGAEIALDFVGANVNGVPLNGNNLKSLSGQVLDKHHLEVSMDKLQDETPFTVDTALSADYAQVLYSVFTALARFRARLYGPMSPIVVWPHHFDVSFLWFATKEDDESQPHMNFGFSPGDAGIPRPYLYAYAYPHPAEATRIVLPPPARWHTEGWTGVRVDYDEWRIESNPEMMLEALLLNVFEKVSPLLRN
jgi:hypothetical protein